MEAGKRQAVPHRAGERTAVPTRTAAPFLLPYASVSPQFASPLAFCGPGAAVLGRATLGANAQLGASSVIRADGHFVRVGDDFSLGAAPTVHIAHDVYPDDHRRPRDRRRNAVVHACTVGSDIVVEDNAVILDGSVVADGVAIEARSIVFPRSTFEAENSTPACRRSPSATCCPGEIEERAALIRERIGQAEPAASAARRRRDWRKRLRCSDGAPSRPHRRPRKNPASGSAASSTRTGARS